MNLIELLHQELEIKKVKNKSYSQRAFARDLGISHGHLTQILKGNREVSLATAEKIVPLLTIDQKEKDWIISNIKGSLDTRKKLKNLTGFSKADKDYEIRPLPISDYIKIAHWSHDAIFHLLDSPNMQNRSITECSKYIAKYLHLTLEQSNNALENLLDTKLIRIKNDRYVKAYDGYELKAENNQMGNQDIRTPFLDSQKELFSKAVDAFIARKLVYTFESQCFYTSEQKAKMIYEAIWEFGNQIEEILKASPSITDEDEQEGKYHLYFLNHQLFRP